MAADSECAAARGAGDRGEGRGSPAGSGSAMKMKRYPETQEGKKSKRIGRGMSNTNLQPLLLSTRNRAVGSSRGRIGVKIMKYAWRARLKYFTTTPRAMLRDAANLGIAPAAAQHAAPGQRLLLHVEVHPRAHGSTRVPQLLSGP